MSMLLALDIDAKVPRLRFRMLSISMVALAIFKSSGAISSGLFLQNETENPHLKP
jgi:hypothetical protein